MALLRVLDNESQPILATQQLSGTALRDVEPGEIFRVVKNGINMTGMPSFGLIKTEDNKMWAIAAFVKKLPTVSPDDYKAWSEARATEAPSK